MHSLSTFTTQLFHPILTYVTIFLTDCSVSFFASASNTTSRKVNIYINSNGAIAPPDQGIYLIRVNDKCRVAKETAFKDVKAASGYYDSLENGTVLVGVAHGVLGEIIHDTFEQMTMEEDEAEPGFIYPFLVKKGYEGVGNHSMIPARAGHAASWKKKIALGMIKSKSSNDRGRGV